MTKVDVDSLIAKQGWAVVKDEQIPGVKVVDERERYPFSEMEVGDCCFIDVKDRKHEDRVRVAASARNRRTDRKFTVRRIKETPGRIGVWRTK